MSKTTLTRELLRELEKLNTRIDHKIVKGQPFTREALRHKELLATLRHVEDDVTATRTNRRSFFHTKSPVRRSIERGVIARLFTFRMAY